MLCKRCFRWSECRECCPRRTTRTGFVSFSCVFAYKKEANSIQIMCAMMLLPVAPPSSYHRHRVPESILFPWNQLLFRLGAGKVCIDARKGRKAFADRHFLGVCFVAGRGREESANAFVT